MNVTLLCPEAEEEQSFYGPFVKLLRVAAKGFGMELEVIECHQDPVRFHDEGVALTERANPPEYLLLVNDMDRGVQLLPKACRAGIRVFGVVQGFHAADKLTLGGPGEVYENWIGELQVDDYEAGRDLARLLVHEARTRGLRSDRGIQVVALSGPYTAASILRLNGLRKVISSHGDVSLEEVALAGWVESRAKDQTLGLLQRYPDANVVWCANDAMAFGAISGIRETGREPGEDILVGGIDWSAGVVDRVSRGELTASMGGHVFDALWSMALIQRHARGGELRSESRTSRLVAMRQGNEKRYGAIVDPAAWSGIDFDRVRQVVAPTSGVSELSADLMLDLI